MSTQVTFSGISIPGFRTRSNTTTVELPSGGSVASAGLISTQTEQAINGFPALMNLPVLGALFRSRDYQRNETELLIIVTPYIVHRGRSPAGRPSGPELPGGERSPGLVPRPRQPDLLHLAVASADARLRGEDRIHHPVGLARFARTFPHELRRTALMAALPDARPLFAALGLILTLAASALGGCGVQYASSDPAFPGDFHERHPIVLAAAPTSIDLYPVGGALDARSRANIRAFAERYRHYGSGEVMILTPEGREPEFDRPFTRSAGRSSRRASAANRRRRLSARRTTARRRRCACRSRASRRSFRRNAVNGRRIWLRDRRSKDGRTSLTRTSAAPPSR